MSEVVDSHFPKDDVEIDSELAEMEAFNSIVEEIDAIAPELKDELKAVAGGKFGSIRDFEGEFAGAKG